MNEDMSAILNKMNEMLKNKQIPEELQNMLHQISGSGNDATGMSSTPSKPNNTQETKQEETNNFVPNFDINTMLKMKKIVDAMNEQKNDPRANLLLSLKPYLKQSRKQKVDQYIQLFQMGKAIEILNPLGGDKKNDV